IGHTTAAAGVAGVLKVLGAFQRMRIPPSLNYAVENEHIGFANSPFFVSRELRAWPAQEGGPRRAAVSSFGFSGTNAHLVLDEPVLTAPVTEARAPRLFLLSAKTPEALKRRIDELASALTSQSIAKSASDVAFTLA